MTKLQYLDIITYSKLTIRLNIKEMKMKIIQINPYEKSIKLAKLENLDNETNFIDDLLNNAVEVEKDLKIVAYPMLEQGNKFFYYLKQNGSKLKTIPFNGIGLVFGDVDEQMVKEIKENIMWQ